jgi:hypothetical protein
VAARDLDLRDRRLHESLIHGFAARHRSHGLCDHASRASSVGINSLGTSGDGKSALGRWTVEGAS